MGVELKMVVVKLGHEIFNQPPGKVGGIGQEISKANPNSYLPQ